MRDSSNKLLTIVSSETPNDVFLFLITIEYPNGVKERFVKNFEDVSSRQQTYRAASFEITMPEEPEDSVPTMNFAFSVAERDALRELRESTDLPMLTLEIVLSSDPNVVEVGPFVFDVRSFQVQGVSVRVEAGFEPMLDLAVPQMSYDPNLFPGLFKDVRAAGFGPISGR